MKKFIYTLFCFLILSTSILAQEFAYITDSLQLRVYSSASADSEILQTIDSGDSVEIFTTEGGFTQVTTYDGTVGWVKSAFLVEDPPAKLLYFSVSEKNKQLEAELEDLRSTTQSNTMTSSDVAIDTQIENLQAELSSLEEKNQKLHQQLANTSSPQPVSSSLIPDNSSYTQALIQKFKKWWIVIGALILMTGFLLGLKISSWRMKKRLHGFRF